jgi:nucleotidyltransferase substrate binding protein (TIGR01987 family)
LNTGELDNVASISKIEFEKSLVALEEAFIECEDQELGSKAFKLLRDATIQRFEFCVELAWKVSVKILGHSISSPKPALREMVKSGLIENIDEWFDFVEARNKSSHSYDEEIAREVYSNVSRFIVACKKLSMKI